MVYRLQYDFLTSTDTYPSIYQFTKNFSILFIKTDHTNKHINIAPVCMIVYHTGYMNKTCQQYSRVYAHVLPTAYCIEMVSLFDNTQQFSSIYLLP